MWKIASTVLRRHEGSRQLRPWLPTWGCTTWRTPFSWDDNFKTIRFRHPPGLKTDHRLVYGLLRVDSCSEHRRYCRQRKRFPIGILNATPLDVQLENLAKKRIQERSDPTRQRTQSWISQETWSLIDRRAAMARLGVTRNNAEMSRLKRDIRAGLRRDRQERINKVSIEVEALLRDGDSKGAYSRLRGWYRAWTRRPPKPSRVNLNATAESYRQLYARKPIDGQPIPIVASGRFTVQDDIPSSEEIVKALKKLRRGKCPGPSGITAEDLLRWKESEDQSCWLQVVPLVQSCFSSGAFPQRFSHATLVLIPKEKQNEYRGIALLEVIYKLVTSIINARVCGAVDFHPALHGFRAGRGTGTAIIEAKLHMQLIQGGHSPLHQVFLDLSKAYDTLNREQALAIFAAYGLGPNIIRFIEWVWESDQMALKQAGYFGPTVNREAGVPQGDTMSPTLFNIIVDAIVRAWEQECIAQLGPEKARVLACSFYADDGRLAGEDPVSVQTAIDIITDLFLRVGLHMNAAKTKAMTSLGAKAPRRQSSKSYERRLTGEGETYRERVAQRSACPECGKLITRAHLNSHLRYVHHKIGAHGSQILSPSPTRDVPRTYVINIPDPKTPVSCPVALCDFWTPAANGRERMREHFAYRHTADTITIPQELPKVRCHRCQKFVTNAGEQHAKTKSCRLGAIRHSNRVAAEKQRLAQDIRFNVGGVEIEAVDSFRYLGRMLSTDDSDWEAVRHNLAKARTRWGRVANILRREGAAPKVMSRFYLAVVQSSLLYASETWVTTEPMMNALRTFHHRAARYIARMHIRKGVDGNWTCPASKVVLEAAGLEPIETYLARRKETLWQYAAQTNIFQQCKSTSRGPHQRLRWWDSCVPN